MNTKEDQDHRRAAEVADLDATKCSHCLTPMRDHNDGDPRCSSCAEAGCPVTPDLVKEAEAAIDECAYLEPYTIRLIAEVRRLQARVEDLESSLSLAESDAMVRAQEGDR